MERAAPAAAAAAAATPVVASMENLRATVRGSLALNLFENAVFFAGKLVSLSDGRVAPDVYLLARCLFLNGEHDRATQVLAGLLEDTRQLHVVHLAAQCYMASDKLEEAQTLLERALGEASITQLQVAATQTHPGAGSEAGLTINLVSALCLCAQKCTSSWTTGRAARKSGIGLRSRATCDASRRFRRSLITSCDR